MGRTSTTPILWVLLVLCVALAGCATGPSDGMDDGDEPPRNGTQPPSLPDVDLVQTQDGFQAPTLATHAGGGSNRLFVLEQPGRVLVLEDPDQEPEPYLDLTDKIQAGGERGLLGLAFSPTFEDDGRLFASYTDTRGDSVLERFTVDDPATGTPNPDEGTVLFTQQQPYANHNGGHIAFGPDGFLYMGLGDGGSGGDPMGHAQDTSTLLGSILRLDVTSDEATAPPDNPFTDDPGADEVWAHGLRNPWRFSFDPATGDLFIADVGQDAWEEVNHQPATSTGGENYGWNHWEGNHAYDGDPTREGYTFPILEYARESGHCSITGGHVYRGDEIPDLDGAYVYADYCSGTIWTAQNDENNWTSDILLETDLRITSFGLDEKGELYVVDHQGTLHRFTPA